MVRFCANRLLLSVRSFNKGATPWQRKRRRQKRRPRRRNNFTPGLQSAPHFRIYVSIKKCSETANGVARKSKGVKLSSGLWDTVWLTGWRLGMSSRLYLRYFFKSTSKLGGPPDRSLKNGLGEPSMSLVLSNCVFGSLHRPSPNDLSSRLRLKYCWLLCKRINAFAFLGGRFLDDNEFPRQIRARRRHS